MYSFPAWLSPVGFIIVGQPYPEVYYSLQVPLMIFFLPSFPLSLLNSHPIPISVSHLFPSESLTDAILTDICWACNSKRNNAALKCRFLSFAIYLIFRTSEVFVHTPVTQCLYLVLAKQNKYQSRSIKAFF